ncbi:MAG: DinB family protein [Saprospiraceae bacterium]|nr:DinB family protein [Saprospiraceae bacterium]
MQENIIADILDNTRRLTRWYFSLLEEDMIFYQFTLNENDVNSAYWIAGHLSWAQYVVLRALDPQVRDIPWIHEFALGTPSVDPTHGPEFTEVWDAFNNLHRQTIQLIRRFPTSQLDQDFPDENMHFVFQSNRMAFYHLIRHEGYHSGQLGLICKGAGVQTI